MSDSVKAEWIGRELGVDVSPPVELDDTVPILQIWRDAKEAVDVNLSRLQTALRLSETDLGATVADVGLAPFTRGLQVKLVAALMDYEHSGAGDRAAAASGVRAATASLREKLQGERVFRLLDSNPFGVPLAIRATLTGALNEIDKRLAS